MKEKANIMTVRPSGEDLDQAMSHIRGELKTAGLDAENADIRQGHTQPDGSTLFYVFLPENV